jgi:paraquat-inducible protein B
VSTESLQALISGGIAFDTPIEATQGKPSDEGATFKLFDNLASIREASFTDKLPYMLQFDGSVRGLEVGAPVEFRGIKVGSVTDVSLQFDAKDQRVFIPVTIEIERDRIEGGGLKKMQPPPPYAIAQRLVERGLRAQLQTGNLVTGQLLVNLDFYPNSPPATLKRDGRYPEIPTVPSDLAKISQSATQILDKIANLPLDELATDVRALVKALEGIATSPELAKSLQALRETGDAARVAMAQAQSTLASADNFIGPDSPLRYDLESMFAELRSAARSIRQLADYLEQNPNALIYGKRDADFQ